jgi:hypothetical protein
LIAEVVFPIAERVFQNTIALGTYSMLDPDAHSRKLTIALFLFWG